MKLMIDMVDPKTQTLPTGTAATLQHRIPYPTGIFRGLVRAPILAYRLGLGWLMDWMRVLVLTTWGRKTGLPRHTAIEYRAHGSKLYLLSGWGQRPNWISNLIEQPVVRVRRGGQVLNTRASIVTDTSETLRALYLFRKRAPFIYDPVFARLSDRETVNRRTLPEIASQLTIVRLDPSDDVVGPPAVDSDLRWLWAVLGVGFAFFATLVIRRSRAA